MLLNIWAAKMSAITFFKADSLYFARKQQGEQSIRGMIRAESQMHDRVDEQMQLYRYHLYMLQPSPQASQTWRVKNLT